jgi:hypothetical protein
MATSRKLAVAHCDLVELVYKTNCLGHRIVTLDLPNKNLSSLLRRHVP